MPHDACLNWNFTYERLDDQSAQWTSKEDCSHERFGKAEREEVGSSLSHLCAPDNLETKKRNGEEDIAPSGASADVT